METIEIRPALNRKELNRAYDLWENVFPEERSFFQKRLDHDPSYSLDTTWCALVNGELAAAVQIFPFFMRWGSVELKVGGIGNVATLPNYRRRGLAQEILRRQCSYMGTRGYDLSLLMTGINSFYEQLNWCTILDHEWVADAAVLNHAATSGQYRIHLYTEAVLDTLCLLYDNMNRDIIGSMLRSKPYWQGQSMWSTVGQESFLVAEEVGRITGYLRYKIYDNQLQIRDCSYEQGKEQAALDLLHHAIKQEEHITTVRAALPSGHILYHYLQEKGAESDYVAYKMWRVFELTATLRKMAPELSRRIRDNSMNKTIHLPASLLFTVGGEQSLLLLTSETVEVRPIKDCMSYNADFEFSERDWITLLLKGFDALEENSSLHADYLRLLFPTRPYVIWNADYF